MNLTEQKAMEWHKKQFFFGKHLNNLGAKMGCWVFENFESTNLQRRGVGTHQIIGKYVFENNAKCIFIESDLKKIVRYDNFCGNFAQLFVKNKISTEFVIFISSE